MGKAIATLLKLLGVAAAFYTIGVLLYEYAPVKSEFVVFDLPVLLAFLANTWIIALALPSGWRWWAKGMVACAVAVPATFFGWLAYTTYLFQKHFG